MHFINDSTGFIVGSPANAFCDISFTTDYGATWQQINFPYAYAGWSVFASDTANIFFVAQNQTVIKSGDKSLNTFIPNNFTLKSNNFTAYPNPTSNIVTLKTHQFLANKQLIVYDFTGKIVNKKNWISDDTFQVDLGILSNVIYLLNIISNQQIEGSFKIVKE